MIYSLSTELPLMESSSTKIIIATTTQLSIIMPMRASSIGVIYGCDGASRIALLITETSLNFREPVMKIFIS